MVVEFARTVYAPLLVDPPPERERLGGAGLGFGVVRDCIQARDAVLLAPPAEGLVALEPDQGLGLVHPGAQERCDRRRVPWDGEVQQR